MMQANLPEPQKAADILLFEAEAAGGFLKRLTHHRDFDTAGWQRIWTAVASLLHHHNELDSWQSFDLSRIIMVIQQAGQALDGRTYNSLDEFEIQVLEANNMLGDLLE